MISSVKLDGVNILTLDTFTATGSPSLYHVAESETTAGQDALGNAIENPRPNDRVLNLTTGTGYAEIADSASLDLTTEATWELWGNFYGDKGMGEIFLSRTFLVQWIVAGTLTEVLEMLIIASILA
jgi:hypothetical protein